MAPQRRLRYNPRAGRHSILTLFNAKLNCNELIAIAVIVLFLNIVFFLQLEDPFCFPEAFTSVDGTVERFPLNKLSDIPYHYSNSPGLVYQTIEVARCIREGEKID